MAVSKQRQHFEMFIEGTEWEEKTTWIPLERNLEMQEKEKKRNICVNIISSFKNEQANATC